MKRKALVTGITGQDGYYLAKFLLYEGYEVYGFVRRHSQDSLGSLQHLPKAMIEEIKFFYGDVTDSASVDSAMRVSKPDEVYHLAAMTFVGVSWDLAQEVINTNVNGTLNVLNAVLTHCKRAKVFLAGSSCMYGSNPVRTQSETTAFNPCSPYATSKVAAYYLARNYRQSYGLFASTGICFNHESPLRGEEFVSKKICRAAARIKEGLEDSLLIGNMKAIRDWGYAPDYVKAFHGMLQVKHPDDFVIATGESHSVEDFLRLAFEFVDLDYQEYVKSSKHFIRPVDVPYLKGDSSKLREKIGWSPSVTFKEMVRTLVNYEVADIARERMMKEREQEP